MNSTKIQNWRRMTLTLTAFIAIIDGGFILLVAYAKPFLGQMVAGPLSLGMLLGILATIGGIVIAGIYVFWANKANPESTAS